MLYSGTYPNKYFWRVGINICTKKKELKQEKNIPGLLFRSPQDYPFSTPFSLLANKTRSNPFEKKVRNIFPNKISQNSNAMFRLIFLCDATAIVRKIWQGFSAVSSGESHVEQTASKSRAPKSYETKTTHREILFMKRFFPPRVAMITQVGDNSSSFYRPAMPCVVVTMSRPRSEKRKKQSWSSSGWLEMRRTALSKQNNYTVRQQFHPAVTWDTYIDQPTVPSYSRLQFVPPLCHS